MTAAGGGGGGGLGGGGANAKTGGGQTNIGGNPQLPPVTLVEPNGSRVAITYTQQPTASVPHVACTVPAGIPMLADWYYNSATGGTYFVFTQPDRSQWMMQAGYDALSSPGVQSTSYWFPLSQIKDNVGNGVTFNYTTPTSGHYPLLTSIVDKNNVALLTFTRDGNNAVQQVSDRYGRSVYYHVGTYQNANVPAGHTQSLLELDHASQVVPTGTANPPDRYVWATRTWATAKAHKPYRCSIR